jgi:hypothetical protein
MPPCLQIHLQWTCGSQGNLPQLIERNGGRAGTRTPYLLSVKQKVHSRGIHYNLASTNSSTVVLRKPGKTLASD